MYHKQKSEIYETLKLFGILAWFTSERPHIFILGLETHESDEGQLSALNKATDSSKAAMEKKWNLTLKSS